MFNSAKFTTRFFYLSSILVLILPFAQISGPFLSDLIVSSLALSYILFILFLNREKHNNLLFLNILILFWVYISVCSIFSDYNYLSVKPSISYFRFIFFVYAFILIVKNNNNFLKNFNISLIYSLLIVIFDGYIQFIFGKNLLGFEQLRPDRLSGLFYDEMILGSFLSKFLPIIVFLFFHNKNYKNVKFFNLIIIISILPIIFLSGERSAFFLSILFFILIMPAIFSLKKIIVILLCFITFGYIVLNINNIIYDRYISQLKTHIVLKSQNKTILFPEHIGLFNSAYVNFLNNKIFGSGVKSFRETCKLNNSEFKKEIKQIKPNTDYCSTHPHNYYLQFLTETGLVGFSVVFLSLLFCIFEYIRYLTIYYLKQKKNNDYMQRYLILVSGSIMYLWPFTTTGSFFNNYNSIFIFLNLSFFLYFRHAYISKFKR